ncbi:hypothetical protein JMG10_07755 [Nostoc ellipsosporum NOK]|nr:hypothetical protein [Nostoc ellipsosporum NOK]
MGRVFEKGMRVEKLGYACEKATGRKGTIETVNDITKRCCVAWTEDKDGNRITTVVSWAKYRHLKILPQA